MGIMQFRLTLRRVTIGLVALASLIIAGAWALRIVQNRITVENRSGQPIALIVVAVSGSNSCVMFENLPDGGVASAPFRVEQDGGFYIHGRMWGEAGYGAEIGGQSFGYVTPGRVRRERARFVIERGGKISFAQGEGA